MALVASLMVMGGCDEGADVAPPGTPIVEGPAGDYALYCALCHGDVGQGYAADNANMLANQDWLAAADDDFIRSAIENGRPGTPMSPWGTAWGGPMSPARVDAMVDFIRGWQLPTTSPSVLPDLPMDTAEVDRGRAVFDARCASCHGTMGEGVTAVGLNNAQFLNDASNGYLADAILRGRAGTPMPAYADDLTEQTVADLVALMRTWQGEVTQPSSVVLNHDYANAALNPTGPDPQFTISGDRFVAAAEVAAAVANGAKVIFADARAPSDYVDEHITGAVSAPFYDPGAAVGELPRDTWIVAYCGCPHAASSELTDTLRAEGYTRVVVLDEGFFVWRDEGYPTTVGPEPL